MRIEEIPGVGPRLRERLIERYGSEAGAMEAIFRGDVADLVNVVSERQAVSISKWATATSYGVRPDELLATDEAKRIYRKLMEKISGCAHTEYARLKIGTLFPTSSRELIDRNRRFTEKAMEYAGLLDEDTMDPLLGKVRPLRSKNPPRVRDRAVVTDSQEVFRELKSRGMDKVIDVLLIDSPRELRDMAGGYGHVDFVGKDGHLADVEEAKSLEDWYLIPEAVLGYFEENLETLCASLEAARQIQNAGIWEFPGLDELYGLIKRLEVGEDEETGRLQSALQGLGPSVEEAVRWANAEFKARLEATSVTLAGTDLLHAMGRGDGVREIFETQMREVFKSVSEEARGRAAAGLDLRGTDAIDLDAIFSADFTYPLEVNGRALQSLEHHLRRGLSSRVLKKRRALAKSLAGERERADAIVARQMEFDFIYAIGRFSLDEGLILPKIADGPCIGFEDGRNLFLERAEPVSYSLGETGLADHPERVAILSGVNSGGKTSLLDLIAQVSILAQMGLPVPARACKTGVFEELYYFNKGRGTLSAGAFESAMKKFSVVENERLKLVLADELEAITEPGASAKIIGCMLDELNRLGSVAVFVSHLAVEVGRYVETAVRVDGIEAEGLDDENNLVVRRSPRYNHVAMSTPELILDRLVRTTKGPEREFYSRILGRFS